MNGPRQPYFLDEEDLLNLITEIEEQGRADWRRFLGYATRLEVDAGTNIIEQDETDRIVYVLTDGELEVSVRNDPNAAAQKIATIQSVAIVGEQSFIDSQPRTATISARTDVIVHRITLDDFDRLRVEEPEIACAFVFDVARALSLRARSR